MTFDTGDLLLVLTRKAGESIQLGDEIQVTILSVNGQSVKMGITAPKDVIVHREEIYEKIVEENRRAAAIAKNASALRQFGGFQHGAE